MQKDTSASYLFLVVLYSVASVFDQEAAAFKVTSKMIIDTTSYGQNY